MTTYGLTPTGFVPKPLTDILTDLQEAQKAQFGASLKNTDAAHVLTQLNGIIAEPLAQLWQVAQGIDSADDPDKAEGAALESVCALTGTVRNLPKQSTVTETLTGTPGTVVALGRVISVLGAGDKFTSTAAGTITALSAWVASTTYATGDRVTNASRAYRCTVGGVSAASGGPSTTAAAIVDGGATWRYLGEGTGAVDVAFSSQAYAAVQGLSGTLTVIETPVGGWQSCINVLDATQGVAVELDPALRVRRLGELRGAAAGPLEAIRAAVLKVTDVIACDVFQNITDATDVDGVPPHSIEVLVRGGTDAAIRTAIFANVAAGIRTHGTVSGTITDSMGVVQTVKFSRPTELLIYVAVTLVKIASLYPADGDTQVKTAIVAAGVLLPHGYDVFNDASIGPARTVAGVMRVSSLFVGTAPAPVGTSVAVTSRQLAVFDTSRISVVTSDGTP